MNVRPCEMNVPNGAGRGAAAAQAPFISNENNVMSQGGRAAAAVKTTSR